MPGTKPESLSTVPEWYWIMASLISFSALSKVGGPHGQTTSFWVSVLKCCTFGSFKCSCWKSFRACGFSFRVCRSCGSKSISSMSLSASSSAIEILSSAFSIVASPSIALAKSFRRVIAFVDSFQIPNVDAANAASPENKMCKC